MKNKWENVKLNEICDFVRGPFGGSLKKSIFKQEGYAIYQQSHAIYNQFSKIRYFIDKTKFDEMKRFELKPGELIMSCSGTMGKIAIVPPNIKQGIINQALLKLSPSKKVYNIFLKYCMESKYFQDSLKKYSKGAAIQNVASVKVLKEILIPLPSLPEQKRIVKILDKTFTAIEKAKQNAEKNSQNSKELFDSYLQSIFANPGDDWEEKKLGDTNILEIIDGDRGKNYPKKTDFFPTEHCLFMNTKNVRPDGFDFTSKMFITKKKDKALGKGKIQRNDVVMTTRGTIGNLGLYDEEIPFKNIRINSGMLIFRPKIKNLVSEYLFEVLRSGIIKTQITKHVSGAAQPQLPIKTLINFIIPIPKSLIKQKDLVVKIKRLYKQSKKLKDIYNQKIADFGELKKSILQKAFEGRL